MFSYFLLSLLCLGPSDKQKQEKTYHDTFYYVHLFKIGRDEWRNVRMVIILTSAFQGAENFSLCRFSRAPYPLFTHVAGFLHLLCLEKPKIKRKRGKRKKPTPFASMLQMRGISRKRNHQWHCHTCIQSNKHFGKI